MRNFYKDLDADGLANVGEFGAGTNPQLGDSDGGGEADGSEVAAGRDPLSGGDDQTKSLPSKVLFGKTLGALWVGGLVDVDDLAVEVWATAQGVASARRVSVTATSGGAFVFPVEQGVASCMKVRSEKAGAHGVWSEPRCGVPGEDTTAPRVYLLGPATRHGRWLTVSARVEDENPHRARGELESLLGLVPSGGLELRVGSSPELSSEPWLPYTGQALKIRTTRALREARTLWLQARDGAGNLSEPVPVRFPSRARTLVDRAIALEEDALEETREKVAKKRVRQSVPRLLAASSAAKKLLKSKEERDALDVSVKSVVERKKQAAAQLARHEVEAARLSLELALEEEQALALRLDGFGGAAELVDRAFAEDGEPE